MSGSEVTSLLLGFLTVSAVAFAVLCLLTSLLRFQGMADQSSAAAGGAAEGLQALAMALGGRLSALPKAPSPFVLLQLAPRADRDTSGEGLQAAAERLRAALRPSDRVFVLETGRLGVLLAARRSALPAVLQRVLPGSALEPSAWAVGAATYPENGARVDPLLEAASVALDRAMADEKLAWALADSESSTGGATAAPAGEAPPQQSELLDEMTGTLKPELFLPSLQKLVAAARREDQPLSLLCMRIEHLARYRDHYGADGERALFGAMGHVLHTRVREEDLPVRIDAAQAGAVLHCSGEAAMRVAQRLSEEIRGQAVSLGQSELKMSVHVGVAALPDDARTARDLLACAERAADEAVSHGRGACVRFDPERMSPERPAEAAGPEVF